MAVLHDWKCMAHGVFESTTGRCPHGCGKGMTEIIYLKPPGMVTGRTRGIDRTLQTLANDHGLTDMNNHGGETAAFIPDPSMAKQERVMQEKLLAGQTFAGAIGQNNVASTLAESNLQGGNALNNEVVRSMIQPPKPNVVASYNPKGVK